LKLDRRGIRFRLMLSFIALSAGAVLLLGGLQTGLIKPYYRNSKIRTIKALASSLVEDLLGEDGSDAEHISEAFASTVDNSACVILYNSDGRILYQADQLGEGCVFNAGVTTNTGEDYQTFTSLKNYVDSNGGEYSKDVTNQETSQTMLVYGELLKENLGTYYLFINTPLEPVDSLITAFSRQYLMLTVLIIAIALVFSIWLSGKIVRPITNMQKETVKLSKADYDVHFDGGSFTETRDLANALNEASDQLSKIEEMRRGLMANLSHDIRTPLTNIRAYAEMIRDISGNDPVKREKHLDVIIRETEYMNRLVSDMSELSRMQTGSYVLKKTNVDLVDVIHEVLEIDGAMIDASHLKVVLDLPDHLIIYADEVKITEVVQNYVSNAVKHSPEGGTITIRGWIMEDEETVRVEVIDEGEGIAEEDQKMIWDRYQKASRSFSRSTQSTGLGLAIVKAILDAHGAAYGVVSSPGHGATFWFSFKETHTA
jgi:signal transduction histidine kinase